MARPAAPSDGGAQTWTWRQLGLERHCVTECICSDTLLSLRLQHLGDLQLTPDLEQTCERIAQKGAGKSVW